MRDIRDFRIWVRKITVDFGWSGDMDVGQDKDGPRERLLVMCQTVIEEAQRDFVRRMIAATPLGEYGSSSFGGEQWEGDNFLNAELFEIKLDFGQDPSRLHFDFSVLGPKDQKGIARRHYYEELEEEEFEADQESEQT